MLVLTVGQPVVLAQDAGQDVLGAWDMVEAVPVDDRLEVRLKNGETIRGKVESVSGTVLVLLKDNSPVTIERNRISKVYREGGKKIGKSTLIGLAIGAGAGAAIGGVVAATDGPTESGEGHLPIVQFGGVGAIFGTIAGLTTGLLRRKKVLIYESQ